MTGTTVKTFASNTRIVSILLQNRRDVKYLIHMFTHRTMLYSQLPRCLIMSQLAFTLSARHPCTCDS